MPTVPDQAAFIRALVLYFGNGEVAGFDPVAILDGDKRVMGAFPAQGAALLAQITELLSAASSLPGFWSEPWVPLNQVGGKVRAYLAAEYAFLPANLQAKIIGYCEYCCWK